VKHACPHFRDNDFSHDVKPFCPRWQRHEEAALSLATAASDSDDNNARHILSQLRTCPCAPHSRGRHGLLLFVHVQRPCGAYFNGILMNTTTQTSSTKTTNGALDEGSSWVGKTWLIHYATESIDSLLREGCQFRLVPADNASPPGFYRLEFDDNKMTAPWAGLLLQAIPGKQPRMENIMPWVKTDPQVRERYAEYLRQFREQYSSNFVIQRLQGVLRVNNALEIVCMYLCAGAQTNGKDWLVVDLLVPTRQDGYGHGEPHP
jgi:hypothetical protein